ncbi:MAG TPA: hypothetical protein PLP25_07425, partial [Candidatus Limiplasma sp.]|nr:hypothetical protein [Candidatus Limiplasma sp.]
MKTARFNLTVAPWGGGRGPMGGGGHGMGALEKPKSFKGTMNRLIRYCQKDLPAILIALIAAVVGTVFQTLGPDQLKNLTNEIGKGLPQLLKGVPVLNSVDLSAVASIAWVLVFYYASAMILNFFFSRKRVARSS